MLRVEVIKDKLVVAHQRLNNFCSQQVIIVNSDAFLDGQLSVFNKRLILHRCYRVLRKHVTYTADRTNANANQVAVSMRRVALEVPLQSATSTRRHEFIFR